MKRLLPLLPLLALLSLPALASAAGTSALFVNGRCNAHNMTVDDCPFDDDFSYGLSYAVYDGAGYVEIGVNYAPDSSFDSVDDVITPFARLVMVDQFVAIGIGVRDNYISYNDAFDAKSGWSDLLFELYAGLEIPFGSIVVGGGVYYTFSDWGDAFSDFDSDYLDYGLHIGFRF